MAVSCLSLHSPASCGGATDLCARLGLLGDGLGVLAAKIAGDG
jgi:hypothetical protein